ncbi:MAG TPA: hypothetical protein VKA49_14360 [Flavitalea sp.]|nr:hypothetical protein [Flavitalea sp.]
MQIGIFETIHFEAAYPVIKLFDNGRNKITIFTYECSFRQFQHLFKDGMSNYNWIVKEPSESKLRFIRRMYTHSSKTNFDILYLNTISDNHIVYALMILLLRKARIILTLHDINNHFSFKSGSGFRGLVRYAGKRALLMIVNEFNVIASTMVQYLKDRLPQHKKIHNVPGNVYEENERPAAYREVKNYLRIAIPGTIDNRRRNYDLAFDVLDEINQKDLPISIVLLGGISEYGKVIFEKCRQYISKTSNLTFFQTDTVEQPIYDHELNDSHFIWIPSVVDAILSDGIRETYGLSISSGTLFDAIKHAKPFIVPQQLSIPAELESSCFRYELKEEIVPFLEAFLIRPEKYSALAENAIQNSKYYTIESIRKNNPALFS